MVSPNTTQAAIRRKARPIMNLKVLSSICLSDSREGSFLDAGAMVLRSRKTEKSSSGFGNNVRRAAYLP
jgi:hypothetical protein